MSGSRSSASSSGSRKASSAKKSPSSETSYAFLNFSHPSDAKDQKARRTVRSHVTRQQHQKEQLAAAAVRRSNSMPKSVMSSQEPNSEGRVHAASFPLVQSGPGSVADDQPQSPTSLGSTSSPDASVVSSPVNHRRRIDPAQLYPPHWIPYINVVLDNYVNCMTHNILNAQDHYTVEAFRTLWMPFVFTDATLLHATLLVGASFFESPPGPQPHAIDVLQLKGMTISALNESLSDPTPPVTDQIIAAVLSLAQYEAFWGETQAFTFHMRAVQNMIQMRGGFMTISSSLHGLLEKVVLSVDYHASRVTGTDICFDPESYPSSIPHPAVTARRDSAAPSREASR